MDDERVSPLVKCRKCGSTDLKIEKIERARASTYAAGYRTYGEGSVTTSTCNKCGEIASQGEDAKLWNHGMNR